MLTWLAANLWTVLICLALIAAVVGIILRLIQNRRQGKSSCGCQCAHCAMAGSCHKK